MKLTRRDFAAGIVAGIAAPHIISSAKAQGATIKIGMCAPVTGPAAESGGYAIKGAKLALEAVNKAGGVLGKQLELIVEDDQTTNPGIVLAFSKLAAQSDIVGFLGSIRSTQVHAMAPDVLKLGKPVMIGGTDPNLTHMGNQWLFRFRPNDSYSGRVIADYGVNTLGKKKWAVLHSTDAFGTAGGKALSAALEKMGAPPVLDQGYANQSQDFTGDFFDLLTGYGLMTGVTLLTLSLLHGATFLCLKTTGDMRERSWQVARRVAPFTAAAVIGFIIWTHVTASTTSFVGPSGRVRVRPVGEVTPLDWNSKV